MSERNFKKAVRINSEKPVITNINTKNKESNEIIFPGIRVVLWLLADLLF